VAGLNGYYATEDIGGSSQSAPQYFSATARQVDQMKEENNTFSHHLSAKFNPPLYHPEAHLTVISDPISAPIVTDKFTDNEKVNVEKQKDFGFHDKPYNSQQEFNFDYPKVETSVKPIVGNSYEKNKKHHIFSLSDSEEILEGKHRQKPQFSQPINSEYPKEPTVQFFKQNIDKRFGSSSPNIQHDFRHSDNQNNEYLKELVENKDYKEYKDFEKIVTDGIEEVITEKYDFKNNTIDRSDENKTTSGYEENLSTFSTPSDSTTQTAKHIDLETVTVNPEISTTKAPIIETTTGLPESVKHLYYSPTQTPVITYTSVSTSVSKVSSISTDSHENQPKILENLQLNTEIRSDSDIWAKIRDSFVWNFNTPNKDLSEENVNYSHNNSILNSTEKPLITETITESSVPILITQTTTLATTEQESKTKDSSTENISYADNYELETISSKNISDLNIDWDSKVVFKSNNTSIDSSERDKNVLSETTTTETSKNNENIEIDSKTVTTDTNVNDEQTQTTTQSTTISSIDKTIATSPSYSTTDMKLDNGEISTKSFFTALPIPDEYWNSFNDNFGNVAKDSVHQLITNEKIEDKVLSESENISIPLKTTEIKEILNATTHQNFEFPAFEPTDSPLIEEQTRSPSTITTFSPTVPTAYMTTLPLIQNTEPRRYVPPLSALFGFPHLRKRVRKVHKIRFRQNLNNENNEKLTEQVIKESPNLPIESIELPISDREVNLRSTHPGEDMKTTESVSDEDSSQLKSTASDRVYHYIRPYPVVKHIIVKKTNNGKIDGLDSASNTVIRFGQKYVKHQELKENEGEFTNSSQNANNTNTSSLAINSNNSINDKNNAELVGSSATTPSSLPIISDNKSNFFERNLPKYLFPLEPQSEKSSEMESSKFIPFEPSLQKANYEPIIRLNV